MRKRVKRTLVLMLTAVFLLTAASDSQLSVFAEGLVSAETAQTAEAAEEVAEEATEEVTEEATEDTTEEVTEEVAEEPVHAEETSTEEEATEESVESAPEETTIENSTEEPEEEPTVSQEEIEAEEAAFYASLEVSELHHLLLQLDEPHRNELWEKLSEEKKQEVKAYEQRLAFGEHPEVMTKLVKEGGAAADMTAAAGLITGTVAAVSLQKAARSVFFRAGTNEAKETVLETEPVEVSDGLVMNKIIRKNDSEEAHTDYTIQLETYATGTVTGGGSQPVPSDIVLVLDQSGSMANDFDVVEYVDTRFADTQTNRNVYEDYREHVFVILGEEHVPVTVTPNGSVTNTIYSALPSRSNWYWQSNNAYKGYYYQNEGQFLEVISVEVKESGRERQYHYTLSDGTVINRGNWDAQTVLYQKTEVTVYESYTYSYEYEGTLYETTVQGNESTIPTSSSDAAFFALTDGSLYYGEREVKETVARLDALKDAVNQFVTEVEKDADAKKVDHRIAVAGFSSYQNGETYYNNTEILTGCQITTGTQKYDPNRSTQYNYYYPTGYAKNGVQYGQNGTSATYTESLEDALQSVLLEDQTINADGRTSISNAIEALTAHGGTQTDQGMDMAADIFAAQSETYQTEYTNGQRNKVVILFTDGEPTGTGNTFSTTTANAAISNAKLLKDGGATVYTIGIFNKADANAQFPAASLTDANKFMHYVSSNYPKATSMTEAGTGSDGGTAKTGYYLTATDSAALHEIFNKIYQGIESSSSSVSLDEKTEIIDQMSEYFQLPAGTDADQIHAYIVPAIGKSETGFIFEEDQSKWTALPSSGIQVDRETNRVTVTGYDFTQEYVAMPNGKIQGSKLVIEIPAEYRNEACFGGNNIPSNDVGAGIYNDGTCYGTFSVPEVNRKLDYEIAAQDQTIYVTNTAELTELLSYAVGYEPDGTKNDFVDISYTLQDSTGEERAVFVIEAGKTAAEGVWKINGAETEGILESELLECTEYTFSCTVTPVKDGAGAVGTDGSDHKPATELILEKEHAAKGTVHVLYPVVAYTDQWKHIGDSAGLSDSAEKTGWYEPNTHTGYPAVSGTEPQVSFIFRQAGESSPAADPQKLEKDTDYQAAVLVESMDVTDRCQISEKNQEEHADCFDTAEVQEDSSAYDFRIHVIGYGLAVSKEVTGNMGDTARAFSFSLTFSGDNASENSSVYYQKNETVAGSIFDLDTLTQREGSYVFTLKHEETIYLVVPYDCVYTITEENQDYETRINGTEAADASYTGRFSETDQLDFVNEKNMNPPSGIFSDVLPYLLMSLSSAGGLTALFLRRRKRA